MDINIRKIFLCLIPSLLTLQIEAASNDQVLDPDLAFGAPGIKGVWSDAQKVQVGTSYRSPSHTHHNTNGMNSSASTAETPPTPPPSLVWFTNAQGVLTEVYYPSVDQAQLRDSQILISDGKTFFSEERRDTLHETKALSPALVQLTNTDPKGQFSIQHTYYSLSDSSTIVDRITVTAHRPHLSFYLLTNPQLNNTARNDTGVVTEQGFHFFENQTHLHVAATVPFASKSMGYVGQSDGFSDLKSDYQMDFYFKKAINGNVASMAKLQLPPEEGSYTFYISYQFNQGQAPNLYHDVDFAAALKSYDENWERFFATRTLPKNLSPQERWNYLRSLYTIKVHQDKNNPGAIVASLSIPWGEDRIESENHTEGGYHLVWPRDLYHSSLALLLSGDYDTAYQALKFLQKIQFQERDGRWNYSATRKISKDGAFPQNVWVDGRPYWQNFQIDQVGLPVHLLAQLYLRTPVAKRPQLLQEFHEMAIKALDFISKQGPWTGQERWEENFGISPASFAVATSALLIGSKLYPVENLTHHWDLWANSWLHKPGDNIDTWAFTNSGVYGDGKYYLRVSGCAHPDQVWNPNSFDRCTVANSGVKVLQKQLMDQGFLKLALTGIKSANSPLILTSEHKVWEFLSVETPRGVGFYRYNFDAYGENQKGRLWPLLGGEHARFAIERYRQGGLSWAEARVQVEKIVQSFLGFAGPTGLISEQVFEKDGRGTGAATPLAWSHAEFIALLWSRSAQVNFENILQFF